MNIDDKTGKKTEFTTIPFSKIQMFSCKSAGHIDFDSEFDLILANGADLKSVQDLMGHYDIAVTQVYLHSIRETKKKVVKIFDSL